MPHGLQLYLLTSDCWRTIVFVDAVIDAVVVVDVVGAAVAAVAAAVEQVLLDRG